MNLSDRNVADVNNGREGESLVAYRQQNHRLVASSGIIRINRSGSGNKWFFKQNYYSTKVLFVKSLFR